MTKTCPHCHATVLSTSQPNLMGTTPELEELYMRFSGETVTVTDEMVETAWSAIVGGDIAKTCFNASIIRADLKTGLTAALAATPAVGGELEALKNLYNEIAGTWSAFEYGIRAEISNTNYACVQLRLDEAKAVLTAPPASPLRGRETLIQIIRNTARIHIPFADDIRPHIENVPAIADAILSASSPEQPAAVKMYRDALAAANARIAELEDRLSKAAFATPPQRQ